MKERVIVEIMIETDGTVPAMDIAASICNAAGAVSVAHGFAWQAVGYTARPAPGEVTP